MSAEDNAIDARGIAEDVMREEAAAQAAEPKAEEPKSEPKPEEKKPEAKAEEKQVEKPADQKPEAKPKRESQYVPVSKANQWRHEAQEAKAKADALQKELDGIRSKPPAEQAADLDALAKEVAGEEASPEVVKRILGAFSKLAPKSEVASEDVKSVLELKRSLERQTAEGLLAKDLDETLSKFPELADHREELREAALAEGNERIPIRLLALQLRDDLNLSPAPPSAEGKGRAAQQEAQVDYDALTPEEIEKLSPEDMDKFLDAKSRGIKKRTGARM